MTERERLLHEFREGWHERYRWQASLLRQLQDAMYEAKRGERQGPSSGGPKSKPPMSLDAVDLFYACAYECREVLEDAARPIGKLEALRQRARRALGYEVGMMVLGEVVCPQCGADLEVARDASTAVRCVDRCGVEYPTASWLSLLAQKTAE